jgi:hypothetical protein
MKIGCICKGKSLDRSSTSVETLHRVLQSYQRTPRKAAEPRVECTYQSQVRGKFFEKALLSGLTKSNIVLVCAKQQVEHILNFYIKWKNVWVAFTVVCINFVWLLVYFLTDRFIESLTYLVINLYNYTKDIIRKNSVCDIMQSIHHICYRQRRIRFYRQINFSQIYEFVCNLFNKVLPMTQIIQRWMKGC